jgi:hypothetical protein
LDSNSDHVQIFSSVIGHLEAEIGFLRFLQELVEIHPAAYNFDFWLILACQASTSSQYSTGESPPIKAGQSGLCSHLGSSSFAGFSPGAGISTLAKILSPAYFSARRQHFVNPPVFL